MQMYRVSAPGRVLLLLRPLCYHAYSLWLFTRSDLKTIVIPQSTFGILSALFSSDLVAQDHGSKDGILRAPLVILWVWLVLLPVNLDNQRSPSGIKEDKINKPWRPLASNRLTPSHAYCILVVAHIAGIVHSLIVGALYMKLAMIFWSWIYHDPRLADRSFILRNATNAVAYVTFSMGAISVAVTGTFTTSGLQWFAMTGCIIFTTVQMQDLGDMKGDAIHGRNTMPLVIGSWACRWTIAIMVPIWTLVASCFWGVISWPVIASVLIAALVSWRVVHKTAVSEDKRTFIIWNLWIVTLYTMPFANALI